jgi:DtxR family Mn-dependent transcriptional regulator
VVTSALVEHLGVNPASATGMIKKLADSNLVSYERYQGVKLTPPGEKIALEVIRHHRLVELYLAEALNVPWDQVHDEAEKWEHVLSEDLEDRIDEILGYPTTDPHGAPIPSRDGDIEIRDTEFLPKLAEGDSAVIVEVSDHDTDLLRYLGKLQLYPQTIIRIISIAPFDQLITVRVGLSDDATNDFVIGQKVASSILVSKVKED